MTEMLEDIPGSADPYQDCGCAVRFCEQVILAVNPNLFKELSSQNGMSVDRAAECILHIYFSMAKENCDLGTMTVQQVAAITSIFLKAFEKKSFRNYISAKLGSV